jgi:hypothetical protein
MGSRRVFSGLVLALSAAAPAALLVGGCGIQPAQPGADDCDQYVSRYVKLDLDLSKIKQWQLAFGLSDEVVQKLETLQGDYAFRARNLCRQRPTYERNGRMDQYFCMQERLDRSLEQARVLNLAFNAISSEKEAKDRSAVIKDALDYYFKQFLTGAPCSAPPPVRKLDELMGKLDEVTRQVDKLTSHLAERDRQPAGPDVEAVLGQLKYREVLPPSETHLSAVVHGLQGVDGGFRAKSFLLISELYFRETIWMLDPRNQSSGLERLTLDKRLSPELGGRGARDGLPKAREKVRIQLGLMRFFSQQHASILLPLQKASAISGADERRAAVSDVLNTLESRAGDYPSGSFFNFLGTLALANGEGERALKYYFWGYEQDRDHLPVYESLSYTLWRLHGDSLTARRYASRGLDVLRELSSRWREQQAQTRRNLDALQLRNPHLGAYASEVRSFYDQADPVVAAYFDRLFERLGANFAYFSALEMSDREQAERVMQEVMARVPGHKDDPDLMDTYGFVKLRFARSVDDVDQAIQAFRRAQALATGSDQIALIDRHLDAAMKVKAAIGKRRLPASQ